MISINGAKLSIDSLIYDWNRIYEVVCFDKVSKVSVNKLNLSLENTFKSFIALKYGLLVDEPDQLYNLGTLSSGRYSLRLTALEEPISGSSSDKESSHHSPRRQAQRGVKQTIQEERPKSRKQKPKVTNSGFMTEVEEAGRQTTADKRPRKVQAQQQTSTAQK